ncbi:MAG: hypothetical protein IJA67_04180 [Oscillospiraceae bacterium]|nr:hypothetical protein [Oscillospiraceae bacterium]
MRKTLAAILTFVLLLQTLLLPVCAAEQPVVQPRYLDIYSFIIDLDISSGGTATCEASVKTTTQTNTIKLYMQLEQYDDGRWRIEKEWSGDYGSEADMTKYRAIPSGYYYRVFVSAAVYDEDGNPVETVGRYSGEVYY